MKNKKITYENINNIKAGFYRKIEEEGYIMENKKIKSVRPLRLIPVLAAVMLLSFTTITIIAATKIISAENKEEIFQSFFNPDNSNNPSDISITAMDNDLQISLLSCFAGNNDAYLLFEIQDLKGNRVNGNTTLDNIELRLARNENQDFSYETVPLNYDEQTGILQFAAYLNISNIEILNTRMHPFFSEGTPIQIRINELATGKKYDKDVYNTELNISGLLPEIDMSTANWIEISGMPYYKIYSENSSDNGKIVSYNDFLNMSNAVIYYPNHNILIKENMKVAIPGIDWAYITAVGYSDTDIYVTYSYTDKYSQDYNGGEVIILSNGEKLANSGSSIGTGYITATGSRPSDIGNLQLGIKDYVYSDYHELGQWDFAFDLDKVYEDKIYEFDKNDSDNFSQIKIYLSITGTKIEWYAREDVNSYRTWTKGRKEMRDEISLVMKDGSVIVPAEIAAPMKSWEYMNATEYINPYFEPENLKGIVINGKEYAVSLD